MLNDYSNQGLLGSMGAYFRSAANIGTLGTSPKIAAALATMGALSSRPDLFKDQSIKDVYKNAYDIAKSQQSQSLNNHPISAFTGGIMALPALKAAGLPVYSMETPNLALTGGLYGLGSSDYKSVGQTAKDVAQSAVTNVVLGKLLGDLGNGLFNDASLKPSTLPVNSLLGHSNIAYMSPDAKQMMEFTSKFSPLPQKDYPQNNANINDFSNKNDYWQIPGYKSNQRMWVNMDGSNLNHELANSIPSIRDNFGQNPGIDDFHGNYPNFRREVLMSIKPEKQKFLHSEINTDDALNDNIQNRPISNDFNKDATRLSTYYSPSPFEFNNNNMDLTNRYNRFINNPNFAFYFDAFKPEKYPGSNENPYPNDLQKQLLESEFKQLNDVNKQSKLDKKSFYANNINNASDIPSQYFENNKNKLENLHWEELREIYRNQFAPFIPHNPNQYASLNTNPDAHYNYEFGVAQNDFLRSSTNEQFINRFGRLGYNDINKWNSKDLTNKLYKTLSDEDPKYNNIGISLKSNDNDIQNETLNNSNLGDLEPQKTPYGSYNSGYRLNKQSNSNTYTPSNMNQLKNAPKGDISGSNSLVFDSEIDRALKDKKTLQKLALVYGNE